MNLPADIEIRIKERFDLLKNLEKQNEEVRLIRCILELSDSDYDSVDAWVKKANEDCRNILWYAEYDNRNVRKYDFSEPFSSQKPYACRD